MTEKDLKEKLIELLRDVQYLGGLEEKIADHMIANGVTVQGDKDNNVPSKWISVKDRLPEKDGEYLVRFADKGLSNVEYESKFESFGYWLSIMWDEYADWFPYVGITHWMPLPEPPKE